jgi:hypothetical protein
MESINQLMRRANEFSRKSKTLLAFAIMTAGASVLASQSKAQTFAEWFSQKKTQKKYLLQQIAALQVYSGYLKQGYKIANGGLGYITGSLKNEFSLHSAFYNQLKTVNPVVKNDPRVKEILIWQSDILKSVNDLDKERNLIAGERRYVGNVRQALLADCDEQITALQILLTNGKLEMSDDERISRLNHIHLAMQNNYRFIADFASRVKLYGIQKQQEANNLNFSKQMLGIR